MWAVAVVLGLVVVLLVKWRRSGRPLRDFLGIAFIRLYARLWHGMVSNGMAPVPAEGAALVFANHTCSADPAFLQAACPRIIGFLLAQEYYQMRPFCRLFEHMACVPVSRRGRDVSAARLALRRLSAGRILGIFPEGGLSNAGRRRVRRGKAGIAWLALRSRAPVIPALITGGPQMSQVLLAWLLPSRVRVTFGPPVDLSAYYGRSLDRRLLEEVATHLMDRVAALGTNRRIAHGSSLSSG